MLLKLPFAVSFSVLYIYTYIYIIHIVHHCPIIAFYILYTTIVYYIYHVLLLNYIIAMLYYFILLHIHRKKERQKENFISITCYIFISIHFLNT